MDGIKAYLLTVTSAAVICGIVASLAGKKGTSRGIIRCLTGIYMAITVVSPLKGITLPNFDLVDSFVEEASYATQQGDEYVNKELERRIIQQTVSYIQGKAESLGASIQVEITLESLIPASVEICGAVSPYVKRELSVWLEEDLGIPLEAQQWT